MAINSDSAQESSTLTGTFVKNKTASFGVIFPSIIVATVLIIGNFRPYCSANLTAAGAVATPI